MSPSLTDHEVRIRAIETKVADLISRSEGRYQLLRAVVITIGAVTGLLAIAKALSIV